MKLFLRLSAVTAFLFAAAIPVAAQTSISPAASSTPDLSKTLPEGFVMIGGKVHVVSQGHATPLNHEVTLRVTPTGVTGFDQVPRKLGAESMLTMDGRVVPAPPNLVVAPPLPKISAETARTLDSGVTGENLSGLAPATPPGRPVRATVPAAAVRSSSTTTTVTAPAAATPTNSVAPALPSTATGTSAPPVRSTTVFDPNVVNDGSIEAAGTGTRRPVQ